MKPGTIIELADGRRGTVVYHGLDGYGIMWGEHAVDEEAILATQPLFGPHDEGFEWRPEAMLREPWEGAELECVGNDFEEVTG